MDIVFLMQRTCTDWFGKTQDPRGEVGMYMHLSKWNAAGQPKNQDVQPQ